MLKLSEEHTEGVLMTTLKWALAKKKGAILLTFNDPGVVATGIRASGKMHIQAAMTLLNLANHRSAPAKVCHHIERAIAELKQIDVHSEGSNYGE